MIYAFLALLMITVVSAVITTAQSVLTFLFRRWRRRGSSASVPAGRFGRRGTFRFDPETALWSR